MNSFRRSLLLGALSLTLVPTSCKKPEDDTKGSGVGASKQRAIGVFTALRVGGGLEFDVSVGKSEPLEITGDDNLLSHVVARVEKATLVLDIDAKLKRKQPLRVRLGTERLESIKVRAGAKGRVRGVSAEAFRVEAGGGATLEIAGASQTLDVSARTAARVDLTAFSAAKASVTTSETSIVELGHVEELDVRAVGLSRVLYRGDPKLTEQVEKPARVIRRN